MSRCRSSPTSTARSSTSSSATARCSAATRRWSSAPPRPTSTPRSAQELAALRRRHRPRRELCRRRHRRVPDGCRHRQVLLHRGQPAHPGRAHRHRAGDRHRHRQGADQDRRRRRDRRPGARACRARATSASTATRSSAASPPRTRSRTSSPTTAGSPPIAARPASASASTAAPPIPARSSPATTIRCSRRSPPGRRPPRRRSRRMNRALREFRIRGVATNLAFLENVINHPKFRDAQLHHPLHRRDARAVRGGEAPRPRHQAPHLHRRRHRQRPSRHARPAAAAGGRAGGAAAASSTRRSPFGTKQRLDADGPGRLRPLDAEREARAGHRHDHARRAPVAARDPHAELRPRRRRPRPIRAACRACSRSNAGAARPSTSPCASSPRTRGSGSPTSASRRPTSSSRCCSAAPTPSATPTIPTMSSASSCARRPRRGIDLFRVFDCLNWVENMRVSMDAVREAGKLCEGAFCYTGDILDPDRAKYSLKYYVGLAQGTGAGRRPHHRHQGHGGPAASRPRRGSWSRRCARKPTCRSTSTPTTPRASRPPR